MVAFPSLLSDATLQNAQKTRLMETLKLLFYHGLNASDVSLTFAVLSVLAGFELYNWKRYGGSWKEATWLTLPRNRQRSPLAASGEGKFSLTALILGREHDGTTDANVGSAAETCYFFGCFGNVLCDWG